ncbi:BLUF domain-containing protein, partial [uncultured Muriicola sp.]|uniref:BLUF domain-containing protein n=1 Tax=uncultured Muriicola sp. TaxID=1583102 RepID=UPI0026240DD4
MKVYQLTYRSKAIPEITSKEIQEIVEIAKSFNSSNDISGCLIFDNGYFIQILEGDEEKVTQLYLNIKKDRRHTHLEMKDVKIGKKEDLVITAMHELTNISVKNDFTLKVFWYNVHALLTE